MPHMVKCPICGDEVDFEDKDIAMKHMDKDAEHTKAKEKLQSQQTTKNFLDMACDSGIMRRVKLRRVK